MVPMIIQLRLKTIDCRSINNGRWQTVPITYNTMNHHDDKIVSDQPTCGHTRSHNYRKI